MNIPHYHINIFWSDEDSVWIADIPDLAGCVTHGATPSEAASNALEAIEGWLLVAVEDGLPIPEPRYRPAIYASRVA